MPFLRDYWYPALPSCDLGSDPVKVRMFGENWVLWRQRDRRPAAAGDRCCHRAGSVSGGWVEGDCVVCPYHGWQYNQAGKCVHIPHLDPGRPISAKARLTPAHAEERYGLVWLCVGNPAHGLPEWPEASDDSFRLYVEFFEPRIMNALRIIDNAIDLSHVTFVHRGTLADPDGGLVFPPVPEVEPTSRGFVGHFVYDMPGLASQIGVGGTPSTRFRRMTEIEVLSPAIVRTRFYFADFPDGSRDYCFLGAATPVDDEHSIYVRVTALRGTEEERSYEAFHDLAVRIQKEDQQVLEGTTPDFTYDPKEEMHLRIDRLTLEYRRYLARLADPVQAVAST